LVNETLRKEAVDTRPDHVSGTAQGVAHPVEFSSKKVIALDYAVLRAFVIAALRLQNGAMDARHRRDVLPVGLAPRGLSRIVAAAYIGVSPSLFDQLVADGRMPRPARIGRRCLWDRQCIDRALDGIFNQPYQGAGAYAAAPEFAL
jgi:predicted DNA-binding transcriptional regulator AlpA